MALTDLRASPAPAGRAGTTAVAGLTTLLLLLPLLPLLEGCAAHPNAAADTPTVSAAAVGEVWPGYGVLHGYLARSDLPNSLALLPRPPAEGSAAFADDVESFHALAALRATDRGRLTRQDADSTFPRAVSSFSCALGVPLAQADAPHLAMLLRRVQGDAILAPYAAKDHYRRPRPFAVLQQASCVPAEEPALATDGSYPSGHASVGWAWALVLAEIAPSRSDAIFRRGRAYAQSRAICGVHWKSDIEAGRLVGAATVARLHADPVFTAQLAAARREFAAAQARGAPPVGDCAAEAAAVGASAAMAP